MLIELYGEQEASVARLASHRYESGSYEQALEPLLEAARQEARAENTLAVSQYLDRYEVSCDALELGPGEPRRLRGDLFRGWCKRFGGDIEGAAESVERLEAHQENLEAEDRAELHRLAASVLFARGEYRESLEASERSLAIYREEQNLKGEARVRERRGHIYRELGELAEAEQEYAGELEAARSLDDDYLAGRALLARGSVVRRRRDISKAEVLIRDAIEYFEEVGGQAGLASCANELGEIARYQGRYAESLDCYRRAERLARRSGSSDYRVGSLNVGLTLVMLGRYVEALGLLGELDEACAEQGDRRMMLYVRAGIMAAEMGIGRWTMAEKMLGEVVSEREKLGSQSYDLAELFERCTRLAAAVGRDWLSEVCRELALQQWRGLDRQTRAAEFAEQHSCR
jgi:tetratricopeptide (TPR) repeat protein